MVKEPLTAKVSPKTLSRLEDYAEREGISKSEGTDRLLKQGLDVEESDMRLVPVKSDGGTVIEDELEHTQNQVREVSEDVEMLVSYFSKVGPPIGVAILWLFIDVTVGIGDPIIEIFSGLLIALWMAIQYARVMIYG
jgi:hypothetical protein